ncbi:hypothetical protein Dvina_01945 [Dactylosporangium vinaceum]|uniref:Uncharacterized protein n=1 Tax=Dactylosporangium vinaceum TaxID=53362 RepID=A0ABV5MF38_9ACTN|nr:hypothetical protein [Dactylosporangium vinaceum]UAB96998.1 hypothetical protein Dvina_01945 [Dactylosporangium vinaceum]
MIRPLRTELRRSNAPVVATLLVAVGALSAASMYTFWQGQWLRFGYVQTSGMFILVPLALAGGAVLGRRDRRTRAEDLLGSTGRPRWQRALPAMGALGIAVAAAHLIVLAAGAVVVAGTYLGLRGVGAALIDALVLVGAAWTGVAVGRRWSAPLLPPLLAAVVLVVQVGASEIAHGDDRLGNLSLMISWPPDTEWETMSTRLLLSHLVLGVGLLLAGVLPAAGASWLWRAGGFASLAGGVAGLVLIATPGPAGIWQLDSGAYRYVCADGTPQICVTAVHAHLLPGVTADARRALHALAKLPGAPTRAVELRLDGIGDNDSEQWFRPKPPPGTVQFQLEVDPATGRDPDVAESMSMGGGTRWAGCGHAGDDVAQAIAAAWLLDTDTVRLWDSWLGFDYMDRYQNDIRAGVQALRALPAAEQLRRVTALRDASARCEQDLMPYLTGQAAA